MSGSEIGQQGPVLPAGQGDRTVGAKQLEATEEGNAESCRARAAHGRTVISAWPRAGPFCTFLGARSKGLRFWRPADAPSTASWSIDAASDRGGALLAGSKCAAECASSGSAYHGGWASRGRGSELPPLSSARRDGHAVLRKRRSACSAFVVP